jgi:sporulation protein YlmC with PRC-barrel domain
MFRTLAVSALTLLLVAPALAQQAPAAPSELQQSGLVPPTVLSSGYSPTGTDVLVTKLLGQKVYSSIEDNADEIGTINDMVVTSGFGISAVVLEVGGFLGLGSKDVAVDFSQLEWAERSDGSRRWVLPTTADALKEAPAFIWGDSVETTGTPALTPDEQARQLVDGDPNATPADPNLTTDLPERSPITTAIDRTGFADFDKANLSPADLLGIGVYGIDDERIGTISDVVKLPDGAIDALIVDVGGFLGLGAKPVAVAYDTLKFSTDTNGTRYLFINTSRDQLEQQPEYKPETYQAERDLQRLVITP